MPNPMLGVFWLHNGEIIGRTSELSNGEEGIKGILDSPDNHADVWESLLQDSKKGLDGLEYFEIPRGRVLYSKRNAKSIVYMDKVLFKDAIKNKVASFFNIDPDATTWHRDSHYTTQIDDIDDLLG